MVLNTCAKGDYNLLPNIKKEEFTEAELYLKTSEDCNLEKFLQIPDYLKIISIHQPIYIIKDNKFEILDLTNKEIQKESIESITKTFDFAKKCNIPKMVLHCSSYDPKQDKINTIHELAEIVKPFYSNNIEISFETDVHWFNTYFPRRNLLTSIEDFKELDKQLDGKLLIAADIEHLALTPLFHLIKKENNLEDISESQFKKIYLNFVKDKDDLINNAIKNNINNFFDTFKDKINHLHLNGLDYKNYLFDPKTYVPLLGEHLPLNYKDKETQDRLDYNFLVEQFKKLPNDKQIYIVLELGIRKDKYNFQKEMYKSKLFLKKLF